MYESIAEGNERLHVLSWTTSHIRTWLPVEHRKQGDTLQDRLPLDELEGLGQEVERLRRKVDSGSN
jgi:hypothetical protein